MVETGCQKSSDVRKTMLEVEVHPNQAMNENREKHGSDGRGNRRLASESTPVEQGQGFGRFWKILEDFGRTGPLPPGHWTERRCRNCPTSLMK